MKGNPMQTAAEGGFYSAGFGPSRIVLSALWLGMQGSQGLCEVY